MSTDSQQSKAKTTERPPLLAGSDALPLGILMALWLMMLAVIGIHGDFPLSDDWAYAKTTSIWLETGEFVRSGWTFAPIATNVAIGVLFSKLLGFSHDALRLSNFIFGFVGIVGAYALARQLRASEFASALAAGSLALNPIHLHLSYTFMTDIVFGALLVWSFVLCVRGLDHLRLVPLAGALALSALAIFSRQPAVVLPVSLAVVAPLRSSRLAWAMLGIGGVAFIGLIVFGTALAPTRDSGEGLGIGLMLRYTLLRPGVLYHWFDNSLSILPYLGFFSLPMLSWLLPKHPQRLAILAIGAVGAGACMLGLRFINADMPPAVNVLYDHGVGPVTVHGRHLLPTAGRGVWAAGVALGALAGTATLAMIGIAFWQARRELRQHADWCLLLVALVPYFAFLMTRSPFFDRYLVSVLPLFLGLLLVAARASCAQEPGTSGRAIIAPIALLVLSGLFSLAGTRDYLTHHRVRADLIREVEATGAPRSCMDLGFEHGGWHFGFVPMTDEDEEEHDRLYAEMRQEPWPRGLRRFARGTDYQISYADEIEGREKIASRSYSRWLIPGTETINVHVRPVEARKPRCR